MKLMRSRFRLISLLLTCVFLLTVVICTVAVLKQAGVSVPDVQQVLTESESSSPKPSPPDGKMTPELPEVAEDENIPEETTIQPVSEYNIFGL